MTRSLTLGAARLSLLVSLVALTTPRSASAHPEWSPIRVNRYCKLVLGETKPHIVYTVLFGGGPALALRKGADANADGRVDDSERAHLGERVATWVQRGLHLSLDGVDVALAPIGSDVGLAGDAVAAEPFSVDITYELAVSAGPERRLDDEIDYTLVIDDRVEVPNEGDSEISLDATDASLLVAAHRGRVTPGAPPIENKVFTFRGPRFSALEDRTVTVVMRRAQPRWKLPARTPMLVGVALLVLAGGIALRRSRRATAA